MGRLWRARGPLGARAVWWVGLAVALYWDLPTWGQFGVFLALVAVAARRHFAAGRMVPAAGRRHGVRRPLGPEAERL